MLVLLFFIADSMDMGHFRRHTFRGRNNDWKKMRTEKTMGTNAADESSATEAPKGLEHLKRSWQAVAFCEKGDPESKALARRSQLQSALMQWCVRILVIAGFSCCPPLLKEFLILMFEGPIQTVVNERANKVVRDMETRANPSKTMARISRWYEVINAGLFEDYGYQSVEPPHSEMKCARESVEQVFEPTCQPESKVPIDDLLANNTFQTWTSQTIKRSHSEQIFMEMAHQQNDHSIIAKSWHTGLLPCNQMILMREEVGNAEGFIVLWVAGGVATCWPVTRHVQYVSLLNDVQDVAFRSIQKLGHVFVLPVRSGSPLRSLILRNQSKELPSGLCLVIDGQPQELCTPGDSPAAPSGALLNEAVPLPPSGGRRCQKALVMAFHATPVCKFVE